MLFGSEYDWLYLEQLVDTSDNEITIIISQMKKIALSVDTLANEKNEKVRELLSKSNQLASDGTQTYRIHFKSYIMYQVRNESYTYSNDSEIRRGKGLILFEKSKLFRLC